MLMPRLGPLLGMLRNLLVTIRGYAQPVTAHSKEFTAKSSQQRVHRDGMRGRCITSLPKRICYGTTVLDTVTPCIQRPSREGILQASASQQD